MGSYPKEVVCLSKSLKVIINQSLKPSHRLIFVAFYLLFYYGVAAWFFQSDAFVIVNLALFAFSCGYIGSIGMYYGTDSSVRIDASLIV